METFNIDLHEVVISNLLDGVFYARLVCYKDGVPHEIDSRTSDALAMAVRFNCPIFTYEFILEAAGVVLEDADEAGGGRKTGERTTSKGGSRASDSQSSLTNMTTDELNKKLNEALGNEEYEQAAQIRDELNRRKG